MGDYVMPQGTPVAGTAYERLMDAQARHREISSKLDSRRGAAWDALSTAISDGVVLKIARDKLGLSQAMLGDAIGLDAPRISGMENGKPVDRRTDLAVRALLAMEAMR